MQQSPWLAKTELYRKRRELGSQCQFPLALSENQGNPRIQISS
jgi:hypothetical protein